MRNKLDEPADLPDNLHDIAAIATRLQSSVQAEKPRDPSKSLRLNQSKNKPSTANTNPSTPAKTGSNITGPANLT